VKPLQLLSTPSHCSPVGCTPPLHTMAPFTQAVTPGEQGGVLTPQGCPTPGRFGSSTWKSQSLSMPSQISVPGPTAPMHWPPHACWPCWHWLFGP
jgi:hypothetical protein